MTLTSQEFRNLPVGAITHYSPAGARAYPISSFLKLGPNKWKCLSSQAYGELRVDVDFDPAIQDGSMIRANPLEELVHATK